MINPEKGYSKYITEEALDAIGVLEDHWKGVEKTSDGLWTTYYGVTKWALGSMRQLKGKGVDVPEELMMPKGFDKLPAKEQEKQYYEKLKSLTPQQARDISGYFAMYNTMQLDSVYKDDECKYFSNLPLDTRSGILTLIHNEGEKATRLNYGKGNKNSLLEAAKTGDREALVMAMLCDKDGKLIQPPALSSDRGHCNRILAAIRLMYDNQNDSFKDKASFSKIYDNWKKDENIIKNLSSAALSVRMGNVAKEEDDNEMRYYCSKFRNNPNVNFSPSPSKIKDPAAQRMDAETKNQSFVGTFLSGLHKGFENFFTNNNEENNNVTGNENVNLQQSAIADRRGANQQSPGPIVQGGEDLPPTV